ncbi:MAG: transposase, partial [Planctomycetota bacterium]
EVAGSNPVAPSRFLHLKSPFPPRNPWFFEESRLGAHRLLSGHLQPRFLPSGHRRLRVEQRLDVIAATQRRVALLRTTPGIGPRTAEAIIALADVVESFPDRKRLASYLGKTPTEDSSGQSPAFGITRAEFLNDKPALVSPVFHNSVPESRS